MNKFFIIVQKTGIYSLISSIIILIIGFLFLDFSKREILSEKEITVVHYDDGQTIGNSNSSLQKTDSSICLTYTLGKKSPYPFAGVKINHPNNFDFENKIISLNIHTSKQKRIHVFYTVTITDSLECTFIHPLVCKPSQINYSIFLSEFTIPTWWFKQKKIAEEDLPQIDYSKGKSILIENNVLQERDIQDEICITHLALSQENDLILYLILGLIILVNIVLWTIHFFPKSKKKELIIEYKATEFKENNDEQLEKQDLELVLSYINKHYDNPELSLQVIKKALRIHENKISSLIKSATSLSYKDYLHQIRITEAKRLFEKSNLNINEVATLVGYGNISTFNRAFKAKENITPSDFINNLNN